MEENNEIKEETVEEVKAVEEIKEENFEDKEAKKRKRRKIRKIIYNIIVTILFLIIVAEAAIGIINMQRLNDDKEPIWYMSKKYEENELKKETTYNLGLYKIIKTDTSKRTKIALKPFFMK